MAINAKNLQYEKQEPAFLRRLRSETTGDRHTVSIARPRKPRLETGDDDGPTMVDEQGETVTEKEYQDLLQGKGKTAPLSRDDVSAAVKSDADLENEEPMPEQTDDGAKESDKRLTAVNSGPKKRKQVKAIAAEPEPAPELPAANNSSSDAKLDDEPNTRTRPKKKKKVKLSFDDPET
jgi:Domain of unknown function (DUF4604)